MFSEIPAKKKEILHLRVEMGVLMRETESHPLSHSSVTSEGI